MGREELTDDPRFAMQGRARQNLEATERSSPSGRGALTKAEIVARRRSDIAFPAAPVRDCPEVMHDPHMHERGMLEWVDHPELGHDRGAHHAVASAWRGPCSDKAQPGYRAAQSGRVLRVARTVGR